MQTPRTRFAPTRLAAILLALSLLAAACGGDDDNNNGSEGKARDVRCAR